MTNETKRDIYHSQDNWQKWINENENKKLDGITKENSKLIINFLKDLQVGKNTSAHAQKGARSYLRLLALKSRLIFFGKQYKNKSFLDTTKDSIHELMTQIESGKIKRQDGKPYYSSRDFIKDFKSFWGWLKKTGKVKEDITEDLSGRLDKKPSWVYFNEDQLKTLANNALPDYRALIWFFIDSGCRVTEAYNVRVLDFMKDFTELHIRGESSKNGFERDIKLKICSGFVKDYIRAHNLKPNDFFIQKKSAAFAKYVKELSSRLFGNGVSHPKAGGTFDRTNLYDLRHSSSCYWLKRYQNHTSLMYRMGWKSEGFIQYYSAFIGASDKITDEDMIIGEDKTALEKENQMLRQEFENFKKELAEMRMVIQQQ